MKRSFLAITAISLLALPALAQAPKQLAYPLNQVSIPEQQSADASSSFVFLPSGASAGNSLALYSLAVKVGASAGFVMVFDATTAPGAVTPCTTGAARPCQLWCAPVAANGFISVQWVSPMLAQSGIVALFSTTGCDTITLSATAKFMGQAI